jgi:hypothetical protein
MAKDAASRAKGKAAHGKGDGSRGVAAAAGVDVKTAQKWIRGWEKDGFPKGFLGSKLDQKAEVALEAEAERHGITKGKVFAKIAELIDAKSVAVITTQGAVSLCPMLPKAKVSEKGKADFMGIEYDVVPDRKTQAEMTKLAADVLGMKKVEIDPSDGFRDFFQSLKGTL